MGMGNKVHDKKFEKAVQAAHADLRNLAAAEILQLTKTEFCKWLKLTETKGGEGKRIITGEKVGILAIFEPETKTKTTKWVAAPGSKLTFEEYERYADPKNVRASLEISANMAAYGEDATLPDGLIPIADAVEICLRDVGDAHRLVEKYFNGRLPKPTMKREDVNKLICEVDARFGNTGQTRMLSALADALDNKENEPAVGTTLTYRDFLMTNPFGADKLVHALRVSLWVIDHEEDVLLEKSYNSGSLRELILKKGERYTEAVRKVAGKAVLAGIHPVILLKVAKIRADLVNRPMFFSD